ncbi:MAG: hypothetical protein JW726_05175 [Anaerolineales bacterium]|nr:hypothetical protein [Anaerolineales bacterium]
MQTRTIVAVFLVVILLLASGAIALAQTNQDGETILYQVEPSTSSGKGYQLTHQAWEVNTALSGGGSYVLRAETAVLKGSGCCCTYLPCTLKEK